MAKANIPEALRRQLSRAGKAASHDDKVKAGKAGWAARLAKAKRESLKAIAN